MVGDPRRAQWFLGLWVLFVAIAISQGVYIGHLHAQLAESEAARDEQAKHLAAFMAESDHGVTPAEIIGSLQAKVRGLEDAEAQNELEIAGLHGALVSCEFPGNFAPSAGPAKELEAK